MLFALVNNSDTLIISNYNEKTIPKTFYKPNLDISTKEHYGIQLMSQKRLHHMNLNKNILSLKIGNSWGTIKCVGPSHFFAIPYQKSVATLIDNRDHI